MRFSKETLPMKNIVEALIRLILRAVFPELLEIALSVVQEIQNDPQTITNEEKRNAAFERIKGKLKESEKDAKDSVINLAIEMAVRYVKNLKT